LTRVWTYQEIKLAANPIVVTKTGFVRFAEIVDTLRHNAHGEVGEGYDSHEAGRFPSLFRTFYRLQRNDKLGVSLPDIAIGIAYREAQEKLDYARSIFPTLGIPWRFGDGIEDAMRKVYEAQKRHATRLVLYHGPPRASYPGWAPAVFPGLVDSKVISPGTWKLRGMSREWLMSKVKRIAASKPGVVLLELDNQLDPGAYSVCNISPATEQQSPRSIELFKEAVKNGTAYLLSDEPLIPKRHWARVGLLVEKFTQSPANEAWVCLTLAVGETEPSYKYERQNWLLLHENPASDKGKQSSELNYLLERSPGSSPSGFQMESPLHAAARDGDITTLQSILNSPGYVDINPQDSRGWTPLHYAAAAGQVSSLRILLSHGANPAIPTTNHETPLVLAVDNNHQDAVCDLIEAGSDTNNFAPNGPSPLVTAVRRGNIEMVRLLLLLGADPSLEDGYDTTPLVCAACHISVKPDDLNMDVLRELLDAGAHVDAVTKSGLTALDVAVRSGNVPAARALLAHGAEPNGRNAALVSPLQHAIEGRNAEMVAALLECGAWVGGPGVRFKGGWTAMMCAAEAGDVPVGRLLKDHGADVFAVAGTERWAPLHVAAVRGHRLFFKWLEEEGEKVGHRWAERDCNGRTAFQLKDWD
jgi:ankyrin repeat protein